jgi:polyphosphate kinase 2 (PPK2 family)
VPSPGLPVLDKVDFSQRFEDEDEYEDALKRHQLRLLELQHKVKEKRVPVVMLFEGWDASGKGGAIKRTVEKLDPRGYRVIAIRAPTQDELARPYLWRFWTQVPVKGEMVLFDRSWYGRVLVERVEKYAGKDDWKRAFEEINNFERLLADEGVVLVKYFLHIDKKTQLKRFEEREKNPYKSWKITDEDWRNRKRWEKYEEATEEMLARTSTREAPWHIVPSVWKWWARVEVLRIAADRIEEHVD